MHDSLDTLGALVAGGIEDTRDIADTRGSADTLYTSDTRNTRVTVDPVDSPKVVDTLTIEDGLSH